MAERKRSTAGGLAARPLLIGMVHLPPLPGAPGHAGNRRWIRRAVDDARRLADAGFDAVLVENLGDAPFYKERVPPETTAAMAVAAHGVRAALAPPCAVGVNVLRNDAGAALAVAAAAALDFVRVNVLAGAAVTDQGVIEGRAADVLRLRARIAPDVRIVADLRVKHARPLASRPLEEEARDLVERAGADAVVVSGARTGAATDPQELAAVRAAVGRVPLLVGSGATTRTVARLLTHADGVIVGTAVKRGARLDAPVDARRARAFVKAARGA